MVFVPEGNSEVVTVLAGVITSLQDLRDASTMMQLWLRMQAKPPYPTLGLAHSRRWAVALVWYLPLTRRQKSNDYHFSLDWSCWGWEILINEGE